MTGAFLWLTIHYHHRFTEVGPNECEVLFIIDGEGFGVRVFGPLFAAIYAGKLDRAVLNLIRELEQK